MPWVVWVFDLNRVSRSRHGCLVGGHGFLFSHALAAEFDAIGIVYEPVEDGIGNGWIADHVVPVIDGHLAVDEDRFS